MNDFISAHRALRWLAWSLSVATFVVLMGATWGRHTDVGDAQVYTVVARHLAEDGRWTTLRYLPTVHTPFFEHLPFGFWVMAMVIRLLGEGALVPLCALLSTTTVWLAGVATAKRAGTWAGVACVVVLATTEKFFFQMSYPTLDPLLVFAATLAALPVVSSELRWRHWLVACAFAAGAVAVKGPFGVVPFVGAVVGRACVDRSWRVLARGAVVGVAAALPTVAFVVLRDDWAAGYGQHQILESLTGARTDGHASALYAAKVIAGRFWPWFPLLVPGAVLATGSSSAAARWLAPASTDNASRACRLLLIACVTSVVLLSIPQRKVWHHTWVVYPLLAMLCGAAVGPRLSAWVNSRLRAQRALIVLGALFAVACGAVAAGLESVLMAPPCVLANELSVQARTITPGQDVVVVSPHDEWDLLSALAFETRAVPRVERALPSPAPGMLTLVSESIWVPDAGWVEHNRARGWVVATPAP